MSTDTEDRSIGNSCKVFVTLSDASIVLIQQFTDHFEVTLVFNEFWKFTIIPIDVKTLETQFVRVRLIVAKN